MKLRGQSENGFAMAVLLMTLSIMAILLTAAMPTWKQMAQREKEAELVFRGQQYARAIGLFGRKYANTPPPTLDVLVQERFLRKKYKDPITNKDFVPIPAAAAAVNTPGSTQPGRGGFPGGGLTPGGPQPTQTVTGVTGRGSGIMGVTSSSKDASLRVYNGATHYNEWRFVYAPPAATPGAGAPGSAVPGALPGGRGNQPGRGGPPGRGAQPGLGGPFGPAGPFGPTGRGPGGPDRGGPNRGGSESPQNPPFPTPSRGR